MESKSDYKDQDTFKGCLIFVGIALFLMICYAVCSPGPTPEEKANRAESNSHLDAYSYAQEFVKKRLPAPNTADFPAMQEVIIKPCGSDMYWVEGYFDAQNRYGANVRWKYHCIVHLERGQAEASEIEVIEP